MTDDSIRRIGGRLPLTQTVIDDLTPADWLHCAEFLTGLLVRAPLKTGENDPTGWRAEKWILGCLATELRVLAHEAGETAPFVPRTFGQDPVERARQRVETLAASQAQLERDEARRLGDGQLRMARQQAEWDPDK